MGGVLGYLLEGLLGRRFASLTVAPDPADANTHETDPAALECDERLWVAACDRQQQYLDGVGRPAWDDNPREAPAAQRRGVAAGTNCLGRALGVEGGRRAVEQVTGHRDRPSSPWCQCREAG